MVKIPCIGCGELIEKKQAQRGRCQLCYAGWEAKRNVSRSHYKGSWRKVSKSLRESHVRRYGQICPGCNEETDKSNPLTVDHVKARSDEEGLAILCRRCNSKKGGN